MSKIPALLITIETKRRIAREKVKRAIQSISEFGVLAGLSDRSVFDFSSLKYFMEKEISGEYGPEDKEEMDRGSTEWSVSTNEEFTLY